MTLVSATEGARIHYTFDGSDPQVNSPMYTQPFSVSRTSTIRARAFHGAQASWISIAALTCVTPRVPIEVRHASPGLRFRYFTDSITGDRKSPDAFSVASTPASAGIAERPFEQTRNRYESGHHRFVYEGYLRAPQSGIYTFYVTADLLARLYIGDGRKNWCSAGEKRAPSPPNHRKIGIKEKCGKRKGFKNN